MKDNVMTREQLAEIERLCNEATAGPWEVAGGCRSGARYIFVQDDDPGSPFPLAEVFTDNDRAFIATARTAIPQMLEHIREREAVIETWRINVRDFVENCETCRADERATDPGSPWRCARCK